MSYQTTHLAYKVKGIIADPSNAIRTPSTGVKCMASGIVYDPPLAGVDNVPQGLGKICLAFASQKGKEELTGPPSIGGIDSFVFLIPIDEEWASVQDPPPEGSIMYAGLDFDKVYYTVECL